MEKQVKLLISGHVQGVFFRVSTRNKARCLGIDGWVKNILGGSVEVFASGEAKVIDEFIAWCHQGPEQARVDQLQISEPSEKLTHKGFIICVGSD